MNRIATLSELAELWRTEDVSLLISGEGALVHNPWTLHRLRGALGQALAIGASMEAVADAPCPFHPPCGYALFHGALDPDGQGAITDRPFTQEIDDLDGDLVWRVRLFGHASGWASEFLAAMVAACRAGLDRDAGKGRRPLKIQGAIRQPGALPAAIPPGCGVILQTLTPVVLKSDGGFMDRLEMLGLLSGLARRLQGLSRWHCLTPGWDPRTLVVQTQDWWQGVQDMTGLAEFPTGRKRGRLRPAHHGQLRTPPPMPEAAALLRLASVVHLGADSAYGAGRVALWLEDAGN